MLDKKQNHDLSKEPVWCELAVGLRSDVIPALGYLNMKVKKW